MGHGRLPKDPIMRELLILGGGGHAKVVIDAAESMRDLRVRGILDPHIPVGQQVYGYPVLGDDAFLNTAGADCHCTIGVGMMRAGPGRKELFARLQKRAIHLPAIRHASAVVARTAVIGEGTQVLAGAIIQPAARIGSNVIVNTGAIIEHDCDIGDHTHVAPGAVLGGAVRIGECTLIGLGARVLPGVIIGNRVTVAAGAVVIDDVPDGLTMKGVPATKG